MAVTWLFKNFFQTLYFVHLKRFHISVVWHFILQSYLKNCNVNVVIVTMFWFRDKCLSPWIGKLKDFEMPNNWKLLWELLLPLLSSGCINTNFVSLLSSSKCQALMSLFKTLLWSDDAYVRFWYLVLEQLYIADIFGCLMIITLSSTTVYN